MFSQEPKCGTDRSISAIGNHAVLPARAAHFHGAVSPRLVPIKQLGGGSPPEDSQQLCHGRVWGRLDRQAGYSQAASLGPHKCTSRSIQRTTEEHPKLLSFRWAAWPDSKQIARCHQRWRRNERTSRSLQTWLTDLTRSRWTRPSILCVTHQMSES